MLSGEGDAGNHPLPQRLRGYTDMRRQAGCLKTYAPANLQTGVSWVTRKAALCAASCRQDPIASLPKSHKPLSLIILRSAFGRSLPVGAILPKPAGSCGVQKGWLSVRNQGAHGPLLGRSPAA